VRVDKIGFLGGTFDPVHFGHLQLAASVLEECGLDKIVFIPSAEPPHKDGATVTSFEHRVAMLELVGEGRSDFECNAIEGLLPKPSYTIDTLKVLRNQYDGKSRLFFIIGADAFLDIETWKSYQEIPRMVEIILSKRKGILTTKIHGLLRKLGYTEYQNCWRGEDDKRDICILKSTPVDLSSSRIRTMIRSGKPIQHMMPESVIDYIITHTLYPSD
jgi:nicotinate-nucleotide adenylyltransferase